MMRVFKRGLPLNKEEQKGYQQTTPTSTGSNSAIEESKKLLTDYGVSLVNYPPSDIVKDSGKFKTTR
jgi:hypothetical protein